MGSMCSTWVVIFLLSIKKKNPVHTVLNKGLIQIGSQEAAVKKENGGADWGLSQSNAKGFLRCLPEQLSLDHIGERDLRS